MSGKMNHFSEEHLIEDYFVNELVKRGWRYVPSLELERDSLEEPLLVHNFLRDIERVNAGLSIGNEEKKKVLNELSLVPSGIDGAKRILRYFKYGIPIKFEREYVVHYIKLFDFSNPENNEFIVSRQVYYQGKDKIRVDIVLYVNGIPLVIIECKDPTKPSESWYNAYIQIKDYEKTVPELFKYVQIGVAAESIARYFPVVPWQEDVFTYEWRDKDKDSVESIFEMLSPGVLVDIIRNFIFFKEQYGNATKIITRYMQYRAVNKIVNRVRDNLLGKTDKNRGLVWHWQGSGKTLTMIFAAHKLYYLKELSNPSIFFILDRIDLQDQFSREVASLDIFDVEVIDSISHLKEVIAHDGFMGKRGAFIVLIHKFSPEEFRELSEKLDAVSENTETIARRRNVIAFMDEGHRSQYGLLGAQMKDILKNAFFFVFTGTPVTKKGRDTYIEFGYPPKELYLDRYFITDSIRDGFTVKIVYQPRLERLHLDKELLDVFLESEFEELPENERNYVGDKISSRLSTIKVFLENEKRIERIVEDIAEHFRENVEGKFKAMIVAGSRKACTIYKRELDKLLASEYSEVVMSGSTRDKDAALGNFIRDEIMRYGVGSMKDVKKKVIDRFKDEEFPKILIVTDMLLTGFDAPLLQTMYLDKPLKEHRLLQAVARTNRPYKEVKEAGFIVDYVGISKNLKRALSAYFETDISGALYDIEALKEEFVNLLSGVKGIFKDIPQDYERETLLGAIKTLTEDPKREKDFAAKYRKLRKIFELLGPNEIKLEYLDDYKWISGIYTYYIKIGSGRVKRYFEKTLKYVYESLEVKEINRSLPLIPFDEKFLENLEKYVKNKEEKAANLIFALNRFILVDRHKNPVHESLSERVERLVKRLQNGKIAYIEGYSEAVEIMRLRNEAIRRQRELGMDNMTYGLLLKLENVLGRDGELENRVKSLSKKLKEYMFSGWLY